ncbi:bifunctional nuclease 2 isoform X2 [Nymphaea colorata]|uniref:bifunctional nuclease 2 isoform X2 n=1 Tax=Nymphaea colorata TaxID=210225 RepID=UPI00129E2ED1|nr:bifunctional nuclease 2 isoform X2 [Nymphaea colorata]
MSGIQLRFYRVPGTRISSSAEELPHWWRSSSPPSSSSSSSPSSCYWNRRVNMGRRLVVSCKRASGFPNNGSRSPGNRRRDRDRGDGNHGEYIEAFLLAPETVRHHKLRKSGFIVEENWNTLGHFLTFPLQGEFAMEGLITALQGKREESPDQFDFMKDVVEALGYEIRMVRITERIVNTYHAHIDIGKAGEQAVLSLDSRPSDAINLARRCKAPIYVNKQIVSADAIQVVYGRWKGNDMKSTYDVLLDSAEGPDPVSEELSLVRKMNLAVTEERYKDAASWRDKLNKFRLSQYEP